jgi:midasin
VAAMNPSGDWGKRELTPALRSRFTEIFIDNPMALPELELIVREFVPEEFAGKVTDIINRYNQKRFLLTFRDLILISNQLKSFSFLEHN